MPMLSVPVMLVITLAFMRVMMWPEAYYTDEQRFAMSKWWEL